MLAPLLLLFSTANAAPCDDPERLVGQLEGLALQGSWAGAAGRMPAAEQALLCPGPVEAATLARFWLVSGALALRQGNLAVADATFAAAARTAPGLWMTEYGQPAKQHYDRAVARASAAEDGMVRIHPEHVQYDGWLDHSGAIFPLKVASGVHLVKVDLTDGSNGHFAAFVFVPPREALRVQTGLDEDIDQFVPVWLGGTAKPPPRAPNPPPAPPPRPPVPAAASTPAPIPAPAPAPTASASPALPPTGPSAPTGASASELPELTWSDYQWLKPSRGKLDPNPYAQTDFTAYTLELMEFEAGLTHVTAGLLPRTQVGTSPILWAVGIQNGNAKSNPLRAGPVDVAVEGSINRIQTDGFELGYSGLGARLSLSPHKAFGLHGGVIVHRLTTEGVPSLEALSPWILRVTGNDISEWEFDPNELYDEPPSLQARTTQIDAAFDIRFNRRDSLIVQTTALVSAKVTNDYNLDELGVPPIMGIDSALEFNGKVPITEAFAATISYQLALNHLELRWGFGVSSQRAAWVLQAFEASWRFGGKTRYNEYKTRKGWRRDSSGRSAELQD